ncbi:MAG: hypothetical protein U0T82_04340 [Bacteroidales bacterium]
MPFEMNMRLKDLPPQEGLAIVASAYPGKVIFTTSFSLEDQVILDLITNLPSGMPGIRIATLDTGRLFEETYKVFSQSFAVSEKDRSVLSGSNTGRGTSYGKRTIQFL